jgi:hypothetical protein
MLHLEDVLICYFRAHACTETTLNNLASGLVANLQSSVRDLNRLHEKIGEQYI